MKSMSSGMKMTTFRTADGMVGGGGTVGARLVGETVGTGWVGTEAVGGLTSNASGTLPRLELYGRAPSQHGQSGSY